MACFLPGMAKDILAPPRKSTAAIHFTRNTTVATAVLAKFNTVAQLSSYIR